MEAALFKMTRGKTIQENTIPIAHELIESDVSIYIQPVIYEILNLY